MVTAKRADFKRIGEKFQIDQVTARIIRNRDLTEDEEIRCFLSGTLEDLPDPHLMKDADLLTDILIEKIRQKARIRIIGDYDVDGVMSSYILQHVLTGVGADADVVIPHRIRDGYGLNISLVEDAKKDGIDTILTCDNGIAALDEIAYAVSQGMTVLVTDHHAIPFEETENGHREKKSAASAVVNPHQSACAYPYKELCGAAVAWNVVRILYEKLGYPDEKAQELLEFVAIATVCDVMSLTAANRILVKEGLKRIHHTKNVGMRALIFACGIEPEQIEAYHFGYILGPCVNATGRLDTAKRALRLFMTEDEKEAAEIAFELVSLNDERKEMTRKGVEEARELMQTGVYDQDPVLVIYLPDVHESIAGLIAGRIREMYERPVFVLTQGEEGVKGSGRSTEKYSMYERMCECSELFTKFGGHPMAAGLSLPEENVDRFREKINALCALTPDEMQSGIRIDVPMPVDYVSVPLVQQFSLLEPFGKDNPKPVFADRNLRIRRMWVIGKNRNVLRLSMLSENGLPVSVIYFGDIPEFRRYIAETFGERELELAEQGKKNAIVLSMVYFPKIDTYGGTESLQFEMKFYR